MKKTIAILFLLIIYLSQTGHFIIYYVQRWQIKKVVREEILTGIPERFLEIIEDNKNIKWEEEGKEFSLKGELYDVVKTIKNNDKTFLYCLNDKNEEQLLKNFARTIKSASDAEKGKNNDTPVKFQFTDPYIIHSVLSSQFIYSIIHSYVSYEPALVSNCSEIIIPPPRNSV